MSNPFVFSLIKRENFANLFPQIEILSKPTDIFVETLCYNIQIPVFEKIKETPEIDLFEEIILKLLSFKEFSIDEIAEKLCLEHDFIVYVVNQLLAKELLTNQYKITRKGSELINKSIEQTNSLRYDLGKIFVIRDKKNEYKILPFVKLDDFIPETVKEVNSSKIEVDFGTAGHPHIIKGMCIRDPLKFSYPQIQTKDIERTLRIFNSICSKRNLKTVLFANDIEITSSFDCKLYFHFQSAIQAGFVDEPIFSDGFVPNINDVYKLISEIDNNKLLIIKERAVKLRPEEMENTADTPAPVDIKGKYWQLKNRHKKINEIKAYITNLEKKDNANTSFEIQKKLNDYISWCQQFLEWGLMIYVKINTPNNDFIELMKNQSPEANADFIFTMMRKKNIFALSNEIVEKFRSQQKSLIDFLSENQEYENYDSMYKSLFSHIYKSDIERFFQYKEPKLYTCLPLVILEACSNPNSNVFKLQTEIPEYLSIIRDVNFYSRIARHSTEEKVGKKIFGYYEKCKEIIQILIPDLILDEYDLKKVYTDDISNNRLRSLVALEHWMGSEYFNSLNSGLLNEWLQISPNKHDSELPESIDFVLILSRILEKTYSDGIYRLKQKSVSDKASAIETVEQMYNLKLPDSIVRVSDYNYENAATKGKSTLGAELLVLLANGEIKKEIGLQIIEVSDKIMSLRAHGANIALSIDVADLKKIREQVLSLSKYIGEEL